jgi:hypothetical protein
MKKYLFILCGVGIMSSLSAQTKIKDGTVVGSSSEPNPNAVLELESNNKGLLLPRVALDGTLFASPLAAHVAGMSVYNTATVADVVPGYYYNDGTKWVKLGSAGVEIEPWQVGNTTDKASQNTQNIYQNGNVGIGDFSAQNPIANLDVRGISGTMRVGLPHADELSGLSPLGDYSVATGVWNKVSGVVSTSFGQVNILPGDVAMAWGEYNTSSAFLTTTFGANNVNSGIAGTMFGVGNQASAEHQLVFGKYNAITSGNPGLWLGSDAALQIGNGTNPTNRSNTLTVLKSGKTAIGVYGAEAAAKPTELLDLGGLATAGNGGLKIRNINSAAYTGNIVTDKVVVADPTGVLKTVAASSLAVEPFQVQGTTDKATLNNQNIYQMGSIAVGKDVVYPGSAFDVEGAIRSGSGNLGSVGSNSVALGFGNTASNTSTIALGHQNTASGLYTSTIGYQNNAIGQYSTAIGYRSSAAGGGGVAIGVQANASSPGAASFAFGTGVTASGAHSTAIGDRTTASGGSASTAIGCFTTARGSTSTAMGYRTIASALGETSMGMYNAITTGSDNVDVLTDALFQIGNGSYNGLSPRSNALTILKNGKMAVDVGGIEAAAKPTELLDLGGDSTIGSGGLRIRNINTTAYAGSSTDKVVVANAAGVLKTVASVSLALEPWNVIGTTQKAGSNTQHIYQQGKVAIGSDPGVATTNTLQVNGSSSVPIKTVTSNYTFTEFDHTVIADRSTDITLTLPAPDASNIGRIYCIKNIGDPNAGSITISGNIEGRGIYDYTTPVNNWMSVIQFQSDGTTWWAINRDL